MENVYKLGPELLHLFEEKWGKFIAALESFNLKTNKQTKNQPTHATLARNC